MQTYKLIIGTFFWGKRYINCFVNYCLPALLSYNNIPLVKDIIKIKFIICADENDFLEASKSKDMIYLSKYCDIERIDTTKDCNKDYRNLINIAFKEKSILRSIASDIICNDGGLLKSLNKIIEGNRIVIIPTGGLRVNDGVSIDSFTSGSLADCFNKNMHEETKRHFIDSKQYFDKPVMKIRKFIDEIKVNSFFFEPVMIDLREKSIDFDNIELDLIDDLDSVYVSKNSDDIFEISMTPESNGSYPNNIYSEDRLLDHVKGIGCTEINRYLYDKGFSIYA